MDPEDSSRSSGEEEDIISNIDDAAEEVRNPVTKIILISKYLLTTCKLFSNQVLSLT